MSAIQSHYVELANASRSVLKESLENEALIATFHSRDLEDLASWYMILANRAESTGLKNAIQEVQYALNSLLNGFYRQAFASLRLTLELALLAISFSVDRLKLVEWKQGNYDTNWASLIGEEGVYSSRYCRAFFPRLNVYAPVYQKAAKEVYRDLSEFVHGNWSTWADSPKHFIFDANRYEDWFAKATLVVESIVFAYVLRFAEELDESAFEKLSERLVSRFSHVEPIRVKFGGVSDTA